MWLRRASFQIHLWIGLAIGLYIVVLSVTGSALVYRNELDRYFATPRPPYEAGRKILTPEELRAFAERAYPGHEAYRAIKQRIDPARRFRSRFLDTYLADA